MPTPAIGSQRCMLAQSILILKTRFSLTSRTNVSSPTNAKHKRWTRTISLSRRPDSLYPRSYIKTTQPNNHIISTINRCEYNMLHSHEPSLTPIESIQAPKINNLCNKQRASPMRNKMFCYGLYSHLRSHTLRILAYDSTDHRDNPLSSRFLARPVPMAFSGYICVLRCG
jgi:hypothetical protein